MKIRCADVPVAEEFTLEGITYTKIPTILKGLGVGGKGFNAESIYNTFTYIEDDEMVELAEGASLICVNRRFVYA